jgi:hypothetical protein
VHREREQARGQRAFAARQERAHGSPKIVVRDPVRDRAGATERSHVTVEEAGLILPRVQPRKVAPRVHQAHHEHVRLASLAGDIGEHLEEVDLRQVARAVPQGHEHLLPLPLPLADDVLDDGLADDDALVPQHAMQARRDESLLAARRGASSSSACSRALAASCAGRSLATGCRDDGGAPSTYRFTVLREMPISRATCRADSPSTSTRCLTTYT